MFRSRHDCGGLVTKLCLTLAIAWTVAHQILFVHGIFQARILEWVAIFFSKGSFQLNDQTCVSCIPGRFFSTGPPGKPGLGLYEPIYIRFLKLQD